MLDFSLTRRKISEVPKEKEPGSDAGARFLRPQTEARGHSSNAGAFMAVWS